jgi:hypothetical protein
MKSAITVLRTGITDLRWHIAAIEIEWNLFAASTATAPCSPRDALAAQLTKHIGRGVAKRRFDYNSIIISLYGLLEQFIESLIRSYAAGLNGIVPRYLELPAAIKNAHVELSFALLSRAEQSRFRGAVTPDEVVANLHSCLSNKKRYHINADAFCLHGTNFRTEAVDEIFGKIGVGGISRRLHLFPSFNSYLAEEFPNRDIQNITAEEKYFYLSDLAERRNEVAHGSPSDDLLSNELLLAYVKFIEAFCNALYEVATTHFMEVLVRHKAQPLGTPLVVFNHNIICLEVSGVIIAVGDTLIATTGRADCPVYSGEILELQVENVAFQMVDAKEAVKVGVKVPFRCKKTYQLSLLRRES